MWFTGEGNGKPLQDSCLENPMKTMKRQKRYVHVRVIHEAPVSQATVDCMTLNSVVSDSKVPTVCEFGDKVSQSMSLC